MLAGAGCSTPSGIPDYRDENGNWRNAQPMQFNEFSSSQQARNRYWVRSYTAWQRFAGAAPNAAHRALAKLETDGWIHCLIAQNVDGLHQRAGSRNVVELHGGLSQVRCLDCTATVSREQLQIELRRLNVDWIGTMLAMAPDGDAVIADHETASFVVPDCSACGGVLKPDVVFFGEAVPAKRVDTAVEALRASDALLVVGSSLMVFSGFRFARLAAEIDLPIAIVNKGKTRADDFACIKVSEDCATVLPALASALE